MSITLMPFLWVALALPILLLLQRWIHRHLHGVAFLITGSRSTAVLIYALVLFPGVLLHELSHWFTAALLGVRTGSFSILPKMQSDGSVRLGYVEYYKTANLGPIRESIIGGAPLIFGTAAVTLISFLVFNVTDLAAAIETGNVESLTVALDSLINTADFLLWLYLLFAIANAMMPSASDRRAWSAFTIVMVVAAIVIYLLDLQDILISGLAGPIATIFGYLGLSFSLTIGVNLLVMLFIYIVERVVSRIKGVVVVYGGMDGNAS